MRISNKEKGFELKDRRYRLRLYRNCFVASEAVDWMIQYKFASSRDQAVDLGNVLLDRKVFHHCTNPNKRFKDEFSLFTFDTASVVEHLVSEKDETTCDQSAVSSSLVEITNEGDKAEELVRLISKPNDGVEIRERTYRFSKYPHCFVASELVDWLVDKYKIPRSNAVTVGQSLVDRKFIVNLSKKGSKEFKDKYEFFAISEGEEENGKDLSVHSFKVLDIDKQEVDLAKYKNKVLIVVNVASF